MGVNKQLTTPALPITLEEAKNEQRILGTEEDALINAKLRAAVEQVERESARQMMAAQFAYYIDTFTETVTLPAAPLISVQSVEYLDADGAQLVTLAPENYEVDNISEPGQIIFLERPTDRVKRNSIKITYTAGYANAAAVPESLKSAALLIFGTLYAKRDAADAAAMAAARLLINPYRIFSF
jgi:uncharacterized phiE125 gp8 family phage protein